MNIHLVVVQDFGSYTKGCRITDTTEVAATLAGEASDKVVRLSVRESIPAPAAAITAFSEV